jgi:hypothetical protein
MKSKEGEPARRQLLSCKLLERGSMGPAPMASEG